MPFEIVRNDITHMIVDAIVNSANPQPVVGTGTDSSIHKAAGPRLLEARKQVGPIRFGEAKVTPGFDLDARFVIHTVGPVWQGGYFKEEKKLRSCYDASLKLALELGCQSIAFPLISTGNYGFPKDKALQTAIAAFSEFLLEHEMHIYLVVFDQKAFHLSEKLFQGVSSYIDQHYVETVEEERQESPYRMTQRMNWEAQLTDDVREKESDFDLSDFDDWDTVSESDGYGDWAAEPWGYADADHSWGADFGGYGDAQCSSDSWGPVSMATEPSAFSLEDMLKQQDAGFTETLLSLIDKSGKKDSEVYKKANLSKQHFSKIRKNPHYKPTKQTAIALALALELDLEQTKDLIGRAGYALTNSSKFDLIIRYFIQKKNYNVVEINFALYEFDQVPLGAL